MAPARAVRLATDLATDLASVPRLGRVEVGRTGPHLEASIIQDLLFITWQSLPGRGPRERDVAFANQVVLQAMTAAGIGWIKRQAVFLAVSSPSGRAIFREREDAARFVRVPGSPGCAG